MPRNYNRWYIVFGMLVYPFIWSSTQHNSAWSVSTFGAHVPWSRPWTRRLASEIYTISGTFVIIYLKYFSVSASSEQPTGSQEYDLWHRLLFHLDALSVDQRLALHDGSAPLFAVGQTMGGPWSHLSHHIPADYLPRVVPGR